MSRFVLLYIDSEKVVGSDDGKFWQLNGSTL